MNKSRQSMSLLARSLAEHGYTVVIFDLYGTGDSDGDFGDASWSAWLRDVGEIYAWCKKLSNQSISICGIRAGALLAKDFLSENKLPIESLILWQPVVSGKNYLTQFLRLKVAADMIKSESTKSTTKELFEQVANDQSVEVSGYALSRELVLPLSKSSLENMSHFSKKVYWLENVLGESEEISISSRRAIDSMDVNNTELLVVPMKDEQFWATQEISVASEFIRMTEDIFKH